MHIVPLNENKIGMSRILFISIKLNNIDLRMTKREKKVLNPYGLSTFQIQIIFKMSYNRIFGFGM